MIRRLAPLLALAGIALLVALGVWQLERRAWKLDLIARVDARVHASAIDSPGPDQWPSVTEAADAYRHVRTTGSFIDGRTTYVQASTVLGMGYWVMTPLRDDRGFVVLVNRGFVPARDAGRLPPGPTMITGLLRLTEPKGRVLRPNDPAHDRWYSRDVRAIAAARGLGQVAPYFIDADATPPGASPVGGLTVIAFPNNHLQYALTWFALALMLALWAGVATFRPNGYRHDMNS